MSKRTYTTTTKGAAIATALSTGSTSVTVAATGVPIRTVQRWLQLWRDGEFGDPELEKQVARLVDEYQQVARVTMASVVASGVELLERGIEAWTKKADQLTPNQLKDLAIVIGIIEDKRRMAEGQPTSLSARIEFSRKDVYSSPTLLSGVPGMAKVLDVDAGS